MAKSVIQIHQAAPKEGKAPYALVPYGMYYNKRLQLAESGEALDFGEGWEKQRMTLVRKCKIPINSAVFTFLSRSLYRDNISQAEIISNWEALAVIEGFGKDAFNKDFVYLIEVEPYVESVPDKEIGEAKFGAEIWRLAEKEAKRDRFRIRRRKNNR